MRPFKRRLHGQARKKKKKKWKADIKILKITKKGNYKEKRAQSH